MLSGKKIRNNLYIVALKNLKKYINPESIDARLYLIMKNNATWKKIHAKRVQYCCDSVVKP